jgi:hypothetical protein
MIESTRAVLLGAREEIAAKIDPVIAELAVLRAQLADAEALATAERERIADLENTVRAFLAPSKGYLANALRSHLEEAAKPGKSPCVRVIGRAIDEREFHLADLREALGQVDAMLRPSAPPALSIVQNETRPTLEPFDPIVMPAVRVA